MIFVSVLCCIANAQVMSKMIVSVDDNFINLNDAGIHLIPAHPSTPNIFNHSCGIPKPARGAIKVAADNAEESTPYSLGPSMRATMTCVRNARNAAIIEPAHNDDNAFNDFLIFMSAESSGIKLKFEML